MPNGQDPQDNNQPTASPAWNPNPDDPVVHIKASTGHEFHIHGDDIAEARKRDPGLKIVSQDPMLSAFQSMAQQGSDSQPNQPTPSAGQTSSSGSGDPMLDAFKALKDNPDDDPAKRPGAYQQTKGGAIRNAIDEAANPFTESTTSVLGNVLGTKPTGALMKRDDESDSQFMARAREAAKHVTPEQIEQETRANNARVLPTMGAATAAGPAMLAGETGLAELPGAAKGAASMLGKLAAEYPVAAKIAGAYGSWLAVHLAHKLGIPLPKILEAMAGE